MSIFGDHRPWVCVFRSCASHRSNRSTRKLFRLGAGLASVARITSLSPMMLRCFFARENAVNRMPRCTKDAVPFTQMTKICSYSEPCAVWTVMA